MTIRELFSLLSGEDRENLHLKMISSAASPQTDSTTIGSVSADSRRVDAQSVFFALPGVKVDGHQFLPEVASKNPLALVVQNPKGIPAEYKGLVLQVSDSRVAFAYGSQRFFGEPNLLLKMVGVTGTNGKTSTTNLVEFLMGNFSFSCGVIGTINNRLGNTIWPTGNTTPGPYELAERIAQMRDKSASAVAMEVSSHALDQRRVDGLDFNVVIFTNLTRDHLDYHHTMQNYFLAKQRLFVDLLYTSRKPLPTAIVNIDDPWGKRMLVAQNTRLWTFGQSSRADWRFQVSGEFYDRTDFTLRCPDGLFSATVPLCGVHNLYNTVGALAACRSLFKEPVTAQFLAAMARFPGIKGRLEPVHNNRGVHVFVDYAHTPDALENVLGCLNLVRKNSKLNSKIVTVFGCGGDRDKGKRPLMAEIATRLSDHVFITSDNPRSEDPDVIIDEIFEGVPAAMAKIVSREADRKLAIEKALNMANAGDVVLVAGKGHEDYQEIKGQKFPFEDTKVVHDHFGK